jgi:amino acid transporter
MMRRHMASVARLKSLILGTPRDPLAADTRHHMALIAFLAWVGLGADGLSSACYGPEEAFRALGGHNHLAPYLALAMAVTVFVIALAYNQVIELFPSGGGGYKVATQLLGARAGLISGAALLVDYALTIAISVASGMDAVFSLLPLGIQGFKLGTATAVLALLIVLNLRGVKESITVLLPIFLGFFVSHTFLIAQGLHAHRDAIPGLIDALVQETQSISLEHGWLFVAAILLRAYSLGGGTYTGLEAVSNNVNILAEPRVSTGRYTMLYMALSLSFTAGGIILLYLLWQAEPVAGQTLNAVVFASIIDSWALPEPWMGKALLIGVLASEAGLLVVAANTGFLGGPAVLANMAADSWVPHQFRSLSVRLVTQNGVLLMGLAALAILLWTNGDVGVLVVLYSINVFLTFTLSLAGLVRHWWNNRLDEPRWRARLALAFLGLTVTSSILVVTFVEKGADGGWLTVVITTVVAIACVFVHRHYREIAKELEEVDRLLAPAQVEDPDEASPPPPLEPKAATAVFLIETHRGVGMHTLLWVLRMFPGHYRTFVFLCVGEVDAQSFYGQAALQSLRYRIENTLRYFTVYCHRHGLAATARCAYGADPAAELERLATAAMEEFPQSVCFAAKLVFERETWLTRALHNQTVLSVQRLLHLKGRSMVIIPLKL